jgi:hypothetical protein
VSPRNFQTAFVNSSFNVKDQVHTHKKQQKKLHIFYNQW